MRTWDAFFPDVLPDVLGCPEPTVERHLLHAAREFCKASRCWRDDLDPVITNAANNVYDLDYPDEGEGVELIDASLDGVKIELEVADGTSLADRLNGTRGCRRVLSQDLLTVTVLPKPATGQRLLLSAILMPAEGASGLPERIADKYRKPIALGALSTLLVINRAPWASPALARDKEQKFRDAIADINSRMWRANTNRRPRVRGQFY